MTGAPAPLSTLSGVVLASTSPRRRDMLAGLGVEHVALAPDVEEKRLDGESPFDYVKRNGELKARSVATAHPQACEDCLILASDTVVVSPSGRVLEKPSDESHAREMLKELRGKTHEVLSSLVILYGAGGGIPLVNEVVTTKVHFADFPDSWLEAYVKSDEPYDKAGGYGIQGQAAAFVQALEGSYSSVVGLPLTETLLHLESLASIRTFYRDRASTYTSEGGKLLAISKGHSSSSIRMAAAMGQKDFGENYLQEILDKQKQLAGLNELRWHFTGTLQSNKVEQVAKVCDVIHSVTSFDKARALQVACDKHGRNLEIFLKVQTTGATQAASGLSWPEARALLEALREHEMTRLHVRGFMAMGPVGLGEEATRSLFEEVLRSGQKIWTEAQPRASQPAFSLGMSGDAHLALEAARRLGMPPPMVRLGTAIFGERPRSQHKN